MPDDVLPTEPIPPPPSSNSTMTAMAELVKNLQVSTQALQAQMQKETEDIVQKCSMVSPLGGSFREYNETGFIMQYIKGDKGKELRRKVVDFVQTEVEKTKAAGGSAAASGTATPAKTT